MVPQPILYLPAMKSQPWNHRKTTEKSPLGAASTRSTPGFLCGYDVGFLLKGLV
jgi:hypothetical protein